MSFTKQFKRAILSVIAALVFASMVVADLKPVEAGTTVVTLSQSGGTSQKFSRDPSFSLDKDSSWITIKTSSPSDFTISASSNSTGKGRIGYVYVKRQGVTVNTYKIIQPGTTSLSVGPAKGSTSTYSKNSNQSVTTSYSWITLYKPNDYNVRMDYAANTTGSTRTGYVYVKEGSTIITTYKITQSATVSVTYNKNGGSGSNFSRTLTVGSAYGKVDNPTRTGYNFTGWYTAASGGSQVTETTKVTNTSNHTLYAHWSAKSYTVSFNGNGGSSVSAKTVYYDGTYGSLTNSSRTGYTFAGWFTAASGGTQVTSSTKVTITANQTLYAHWTPNNYTVSFNSQGGSSVSSKTVTFNSTYGTLSNPTKTGYTFAGWYTAASGGTKITSSSTVTTAGNHTLYAHWTANTYTITYDKNGGAGENFTRSITYGSNYGKVDNPTRTGYTFAGYYTAKSGGTQVTETTKMLTAGSHTLYAHWTAKTYTVSFNSQGGSSVASKTVTYGCFYETLASPTKEGYTFAGWYTAASGGNKVTASTTVTTASNHTLYAHWTGKTYTVSFDSQGGSSVSSKTVTYGSTYGTLTSPTKTGYTFAGWYTAASGGSQKTASSTVSTAGNHTLYAHWTANNFTITYDKNDGSGSTFTKSVAYGSTYGKVDTPSRTGYTFNGYYTAKSGGSQVTETTKMLTANNHTLYGRWTPKTFTVSFDSQGGSSVASKTVTYDGTYGTLTNPTKEGYTFDGWYTAASGGTKITASTKVTLTANQTLYAHYTQIVVTVTYDKNGGSGDNYTRKIAYGSAYGKVDNPTKTGYDFRGWYTSTAYETQVTETTLMKKTVNHTLYAKWTPKTFTITFDSQGGSSVASKTVTYDGTYGTLTNPTKEGYTFDGWYTAASGGTKITASTKVTLTANQTLYAHYTQIVVTVTYDKNGGSGDNYTRKIAYGSTYGKVDNPTKTGYDFRGWWTSTSYETQVTETTLMKKTVNHTLYAKWTPKTFTITFDSQGGSSVASKTVTYASAYGSLPSPTKIGYTFTGWYTAVSGGSQKTASTAVTTTGDHTLYAHWTANIFTLSFNSNGGSTVSSTSITYGNKYGTLPSPTKTGYTFVGWYTAASGGSKVSSSTIATTASNHTLYARWTADTYTVDFDSQGGSYVSPETVTYGSTYGSLPSPTKKGFTFDGWYTAASGGSLITSNTTVARAGDHTLYAHWTGITVKLKFNSKGGSVVSDTTVTYGKEYGTLPIPTREGYTFDGWARSSINGTLVTASTIVEADFDHNLYAYWTVKSLSISFDSQGGSQVDCITATYGKIYGELPTPTRKDYIFDGWYMEKNGGCQITPYTIVRAESDQTLYAHWTKKTKITIKINTDPSYEDERTIGEAFETLPPIPGPPPSGFIFDGWFTEKEGGKRITSDTIVTPSIQTLYAHWKPANGVKDDWEPKPIKVLVIKFDPMITIKNGEQVYLHELMEHLDVKKSTIRKWYDPDTLAKEFVNEMKEVSHGNVNYEIVDSIPLDEFPSSTQMRPDPRPYTTPWEWTAPLMQYSPLEYYNTLITACNSTEGNYWDYSGWINTGKTFDYDKYLEKLNVYNRVNDGEIDEVWIFTGPCCGTGLSESMMIGEDPFYINGPPMVKEGVRNFVVFGFCFETGLGNMLEDAGHRMEWTMSRVYSGVSGEAQREVGFDITKENYKKGTDKDGNIIYKQYSELNAWEKFWAHDLVTGGSIIAGVGSVHCGPNARKQYDWNNRGVDIDKMERDTPVQVQSYCDNWLDYPYLSEISRYVGSDEWGGDQIGHHRWWLEHIPHAKGTTYGKYNNWWKYYLLEDMK